MTLFGGVTVGAGIGTGLVLGIAAGVVLLSVAAKLLSYIAKRVSA